LLPACCRAFLQPQVRAGQPAHAKSTKAASLHSDTASPQPVAPSLSMRAAHEQLPEPLCQVAQLLGVLQVSTGPAGAAAAAPPARACSPADACFHCPGSERYVRNSGRSGRRAKSFLAGGWQQGGPGPAAEPGRQVCSQPKRTPPRPLRHTRPKSHPLLHSTLCRYKGMQAAFASTSPAARQLAGRVGAQLAPGLCLGSPPAGSTANASDSPHDGGANKEGLFAAVLPPPKAFAALVATELGAAGDVRHPRVRPAAAHNHQRPPGHHSLPCIPAPPLQP
jgi:hypothetical protein